MRLLPSNLYPHRHPTRLMHQNMAMQHPNPHIPRLKPQHRKAPPRHHNRILPQRIFQIEIRNHRAPGVRARKVTSPSEVGLVRCEDVEGMPMEMEGMRPIVEVVDD